MPTRSAATRRAASGCWSIGWSRPGTAASASSAGPSNSHGQRPARRKRGRRSSALHGITDVRFADGDFDHDSGEPRSCSCCDAWRRARRGDLRQRHDGVGRDGRRAIQAWACASRSDVSIVGFDGSPQGRWPSYDLVTIRQPTREMVEAAADMLIARIADPDAADREALLLGPAGHRRLRAPRLSLCLLAPAPAV